MLCVYQTAGTKINCTKWATAQNTSFPKRAKLEHPTNQPQKIPSLQEAWYGVTGPVRLRCACIHRASPTSYSITLPPLPFARPKQTDTSPFRIRGPHPGGGGLGMPTGVNDHSEEFHTKKETKVAKRPQRGRNQANRGGGTSTTVGRERCQETVIFLWFAVDRSKFNSLVPPKMAFLKNWSWMHWNGPFDFTSKGYDVKQTEVGEGLRAHLNN